MSALQSNSTGSNNTASGWNALRSNTTGSNNSAAGVSSLHNNTSGIYNTASGYEALYSNSGGSGNTADGFRALYLNKSGFNTAIGYEALLKSNAHYNIGVGYQAGINLTTGTFNIDIGNQRMPGESGVIRIGTAGQQTKAFIAGISNFATGGAGVVIDTTTGELGISGGSSKRFKTAIAPMGSDTAKLEQLRPVTFRYRADPHRTLRYGLIAEEVDKVYPELVIRDASGKIQGVLYEELAPMLLNEMQQQHTQMAGKIDALMQQVAELKALNQAMHVALRELQAKDGLIAQR